MTKFLTYGISPKRVAFVVGVLGFLSYGKFPKEKPAESFFKNELEEFAFQQDKNRFPEENDKKTYPFGEYRKNKAKYSQYKTDTVYISPKAISENVYYVNRGYYSSSQKEVTLHYFKTTEDSQLLKAWVNSLNNNRDVVLLHELKHMRNNKNFNLPLNLEHFVLMCKHDEVSASIEEILYRREKFLKTGNIEELYDTEGTYSYYGDAIKKGLFYPQCGKMSLYEKKILAYGTLKEWEKNMEEIYQDRFCQNMSAYAQKNSFAAMIADTKDSYHQMLNTFYTFDIDGQNVNLSSFIPEETKTTELISVYQKMILTKAYIKLKKRQLKEIMLKKQGEIHQFFEKNLGRE